MENSPRALKNDKYQEILNSSRRSCLLYVVSIIDNRFQYYKNHQTFHRSYTVQPTPAPDTVNKRITVYMKFDHA